MTDDNDVRARGQVAPLVVIVMVVLFTLTSAGANLIPSHRPTAAQLRAEQMTVVIEERRARLAVLGAIETCDRDIAHERARLLAMDGQWQAAHGYADRYEQRCGADAIVRGWGDAPHHHRVSSFVHRSFIVR